jgi:large subunit ribosomal protein L3
VPEAGLVDEAAVHEIPALPSDEEVAAIAAEQEAGGALDTETEAAAEEATETPADETKPKGEGSADESKEG